SAAGEAGRLESVDAGVGSPQAVIGSVVVAGPALGSAGAARAARREDVGRTRARGARAKLGDVALSGGGAAGEGRSLEDVNARVAGAGAVIGGVVVARSALGSARAARAARREDVSRTCAR